MADEQEDKQVEINEPAEATPDKPTKKPKADKPTEKPAEGVEEMSAAEKPEEATEQSAGAVAETPADKPDDKPADEPAEEPAEEPGVSAPPLSEGVHYIWGTGRRKQSSARVRIRPGTGKFLINKRELDVYFTADRDRNAIIEPLATVNMVKAWDIWVNVSGGGFVGQAGAVTLGLARALIKAVPETEHALRGKGLLTRDARMKERKKYGQKGARKKFQFSKR